MYQIKILSNSIERTKQIGEALALSIMQGSVVGLVGELGSGKTVFVKGFARGLGLDPHDITSPTFTIINEYTATVPLYHFDLYRLENFDQFLDIGAEDYLWGEGICAVEWADLFADQLPEHTLFVRFSVQSETDRLIQIESKTTKKLDESRFRKELRVDNIDI